MPEGFPTPRFRQNFGNYLLLNGSIGYWLGDDRQHRLQLRVVNILNTRYAERFGFGNQRLSEAFITGRIALNSDAYFYGYPFEGKPRAFYLNYQTNF